MDGFKIVNGIPPKTLGTARFPISQLQPGQGFVVPFEEEARLRIAARNHNSKHRDKFISVRKVVNGVWCGRIT